MGDPRIRCGMWGEDSWQPTAGSRQQEVRDQSLRGRSLRDPARQARRARKGGLIREGREGTLTRVEQLAASSRQQAACQGYPLLLKFRTPLCGV